MKNVAGILHLAGTIVSSENIYKEKKGFRMVGHPSHKTLANDDWLML
jgi:hypothetical protein